ncbi:5098_t:CDS:2, partial [Cetraspora pellucida]
VDNSEALTRLTHAPIAEKNTQRPKAVNRSANVFEDTSGDASNTEQEHTLPQFGVPIPSYPSYNYNEVQPIQPDFFFFSHIKTNDMFNNNTPVNFFDNTFSLTNNLSTYSSILPIPSYPSYNYNEEFQPIQPDFFFFSHINANDMFNNSTPINCFDNTFSLTNN